MQAQSSFHRHTFSIPNPSRRFTTSAPRQPIRPAPLSKILCSALAVTACNTFVLGSELSDGGGAGWLVLSFWSGRSLNEARHEWDRRTRRKGKSKEKEQAEPFGAHGVFTALVLATQSLLFASSLNAVGPLRSTLLVTASDMAVAGSLMTWRSVAILTPLLTSCVIVLYQLAVENGSMLVVLPLLLLCAVTMVSKRKSSGSTTSQGREVRSSNAFAIVMLAAIIAVGAVISGWRLGFVPAPWPTMASPDARFLSLLTAVLAYWLPLSLPSNLTSKRSLRIRTARDHIALLGAVFALQAFAFRPQPTQLDSLVIGPLALISLVLYEPPPPPLKEDMQGWRYPKPVTNSQSWSLLQLLPAAWRPHLQTILNTPSSSKIFYFLLLNLAYMGVQMVYGVLTNSLGLISDAIHMAFDCLGLAVGLWASVASTWKPDQQYTFGYGRVETLSGFANGCFLILISVFIIFEAIQRVINPPELMAIDRLLWVSSVGLAINLFGMWATGGHHHHGHGHSHHDHSHDHSHGHGRHHVAVNEKKVDHRHDHDQKPAVRRKASQGFSHSVHTSPPRQVRKRSSQVNIKTAAIESSKVHQEPLHCDDPHHDHGHAKHDTCDDHHHDHSHGHDSHDHSHDHAHSHNMRGVFLHVLADTLGSVGVIVSTILIKLTGWSGFDPLASIFIAVLIMASVIPLVIDSGRVLCLDVGAGKEKEIRTALTELASVEGLSNYASPRFWPRCEGELVGSIHIHLAPSPSAIDPSRPSADPGKDSRGQTIYSNSAKVISRVEKVLKGKIQGLSELIIQVEGSEDRPFCTCTTGR